MKNLLQPFCVVCVQDALLEYRPFQGASIYTKQSSLNLVLCSRLLRIKTRTSGVFRSAFLSICVLPKNALRRSLYDLCPLLSLLFSLMCCFRLYASLHVNLLDDATDLCRSTSLCFHSSSVVAFTLSAHSQGRSGELMCVYHCRVKIQLYWHQPIRNTNC